MIKLNKSYYKRNIYKVKTDIFKKKIVEKILIFYLNNFF